MKTCSLCGIQKSEADFYFHNQAGSLYSKCKVCTKKKSLQTLRRHRAEKRPSRIRYDRFCTIRDRCKRRGRLFALTPRDIGSILSQEFCFYCGETPTMKTVERKDNQKGYILENCVMACMKCNSLKGALAGENLDRMIKILSKLS